jgi:hypothetical protein
MAVETKCCFKCGEAKSLDDFYRHSMMTDGRLGKCKECTCQDVRDNRTRRADFYRAYERARSTRQRRVPRFVTQANKAVYTAVKNGTLVRPAACEECGRVCRVDGAHFNYVEKLRVRWLCRSCHTKWDASKPKSKTHFSKQARS